MKVQLLTAVAFVALLFETALAEGDLVAGQNEFAERCALCHIVTEQDGPLKGVGGRPVATAKDYVSEDTLVFTKMVAALDDETLDEFLECQGVTVNGTKMLASSVMDSADRADLVEFLKPKN